jgi:hypothetical protein
VVVAVSGFCNSGASPEHSCAQQDQAPVARNLADKLCVGTNHPDRTKLDEFGSGGWESNRDPPCLRVRIHRAARRKLAGRGSGKDLDFILL